MGASLSIAKNVCGGLDRAQQYSARHVSSHICRGRAQSLGPWTGLAQTCQRTETLQRPQILACTHAHHSLTQIRTVALTSHTHVSLEHFGTLSRLLSRSLYRSTRIESYRRRRRAALLIQSLPRTIAAARFTTYVYTPISTLRHQHTLT